MAKSDRIETWGLALDRVQAAASAFKATVKLFDLGGPESDATKAWAAVEASRDAFIAAMKREAIAFRRITEPPDQTEMPGTEAPNYAGPKMLPQASDLLDASGAGE